MRGPYVVMSAAVLSIKSVIGGYIFTEFLVRRYVLFVRKSELVKGDEPMVDQVGAITQVVWEDVISEVTRRHVHMEAYGDTDTGRTSFACTAPGPIALIHCSEKWEVACRFADKKDIKMVNFWSNLTGRLEERSRRATECVDRMTNAYYEASEWAETIVLDTHNDGWTFFQFAEYGTQTPKEKSGALAWAEINSKWLSFIKHYKQPGLEDKCNVILIGQKKDEYKGQPPKSYRTGKTVWGGQRGIPFNCDVRVELDRDESGGFVGTVRKSWINDAVRGIEFSGNEGPLALTFPAIMSLITSVDKSEWGG